MKQSRAGEKHGSGAEDCECHCNLPSLGQLQKKFLNLIAKLFYKHGKFVSFNIEKNTNRVKPTITCRRLSIIKLLSVNK